MSAPFCTACGASVAAGTRFCTKCGQPIGQAAPPPPPAYEPTPATPSAPPPTEQPTLHFEPWSAPAPSVPQEPLPPPPPVMMEEPVKQGSGAGIWIAVFGLMLLVGGAGLWFYTVRMRAANATSIQVAATQPEPPAPPPAPTPAPTPEVVPPNPDLKPKDSAPPPTSRTAPTPEPKSEQEGSPPIAPPPVPVADPGPSTQTPAAPTPALRKPQGPTSGVLHAAVEVAQYGEVVFDNLPNGRLKFTYDHSLWMPTISRQANGTQTLVMRSLKPGVQRVCDVKWEIVQ